MTEARKQLAKYERQVTRLTTTEVGIGLDVHSRAAYLRIDERVKASGLKLTENPVKENSYFLFVLGIGLAQHLETVVERTNCRVLVLVEPNIDMFYHSLSVFDWGTLISRMRERSGIEFQLGMDAEHTGLMMNVMFRQYSPSCLDGATLYKRANTSTISQNF